MFNTFHFLTRLMLLVFLMLRTEVKQAVEATVSEHWSFPDRTDGDVVTDVENRQERQLLLNTVHFLTKLGLLVLLMLREGAGQAPEATVANHCVFPD